MGYSCFTADEKALNAGVAIVPEPRPRPRISLHDARAEGKAASYPVYPPPGKGAVGHPSRFMVFHGHDATIALARSMRLLCRLRVRLVLWLLVRGLHQGTHASNAALLTTIGIWV